jgi:hypothetical protein
MGFQVADVVVNHKHKTIGIVLDVFDRGDIRTDADGVVYEGDCELYCCERHAEYSIAPSTAAKLATKARR